MTTSFQQQSRMRKLAYLGLIVVLLSATLVWKKQVIEVQADAKHLALREQELGQVELTGSLVRRSLVGLEGVVVCGLWWDAMEKQKKMEWNELEVRVKQITRLQPHFVHPWLFQSWNLAYNVSAECDSVRDKYFYIARGIELLADGERQNRNNPDIRFELAIYYRSKIGEGSDYSDTLRCLFQLSAIDPVERDPNRFWQPNGQINLPVFESFCKDHPHLVRRLRETKVRSLRCDRPEFVVDFMTERRVIKDETTQKSETVLEPIELPMRFVEIPRDRDGRLLPTKEKSRLKSADQQFPVVPPHGSVRPEFSPNVLVMPDHFDNYLAAEEWFDYAQKPVPPPSGQFAKDLDESYDRMQLRMPRKPQILIFRSFPVLSHAKYADHTQQDGWFDEGWEIDEGRLGRDRWFEKKVVVGGGRNWCGDAWREVYEARRKYGVDNGILPARDHVESAPILQQLVAKAKLYEQHSGTKPGQLKQELRPEEMPADLRESYDAHLKLAWYGRVVDRVNFVRTYSQSAVEFSPEAIGARKMFWQASRKVRFAEPAEAIKDYYVGLEKWKTVIDRNDEICKILLNPDAAAKLQEDAYVYQYRYLERLQEERGPWIKQLLAVEDYLTLLGARPGGPLIVVPSLNLTRTSVLKVPFKEPFAGRLLPAAIRQGEFIATTKGEWN